MALGRYESAQCRGRLIKLFQFAPVWGLRNASPFCMKVETYLRMTGLPYETIHTLNLTKAPRGKLPYIEDRGRTLGDSGLIVEYLKSTYGDSLDQNLSPLERAQALALQRLIEEHLYWCGIYDRWAVDAHWALTKPAFFGSLPPLWRQIVPELARKTLLRQLHGQGMGRYSEQEIYAVGQKNLTALSDFLADKPFFLGESPTSLDAIAHAFLANILWAPIESSMKAHAQSLANLEPYCRRMQVRYFYD